MQTVRRAHSVTAEAVCQPPNACRTAVAARAALTAARGAATESAMAATKAKSDLRAVGKRIAAAAARYPGASLDHPWGEEVYKVGGKVFIFLGADADNLGLSVKLPQSSGAALLLPFASPTA